MKSKKTLLTASLFAAPIIGLTHADAAVAAFDVGLAGSPVQVGFVGYTVGTGVVADPASGYTFELTGAPASQGRDRGVAATMGGADNNDNPVPEGEFSALYRDFLFASSSSEFTLSFTNLEPDTEFSVNVWSYDSGATGSATAVSQSFNVGGTDVALLEYEGDNGTGAGLDPDTGALSDYSVAFTLTSDASGNASFTSVSSSSQGARINGVQIAAVPEPTAVSMIALGAFGLIVRRRR